MACGLSILSGRGGKKARLNTESAETAKVAETFPAVMYGRPALQGYRIWSLSWFCSIVIPAQAGIQDDKTRHLCLASSASIRGCT